MEMRGKRGEERRGESKVHRKGVSAKGGERVQRKQKVSVGNEEKPEKMVKLGKNESEAMR